jgi:geranylgeranyl diphosphate synthase type I
MNVQADQPAVPETLARCRRMVEPALREAVGRLHPQVGRMAAYTFGWCDADGDPCRDGRGKGLRPALVVLSAEAVGPGDGDGERAVPGAVAVELVHAFSIVHDDIMDGDQRRRDRPTVWKAFGLGSAVLVGDALLALAVDTLAHAPDEALRRMSDTLLEIVLGQADDLAFESRPWTGPQAVTPEEYTRMAARKTGSLTGCAAALGAVLAGAPQPLVEAMATMGRQLGLGFQAVDDLLGIWGDPQATGKPVYNDLRRNKKTLPVISALTTTDNAATTDERAAHGEAAAAISALTTAGGTAAYDERAAADGTAATGEAAVADGAAAELAALLAGPRPAEPQVIASLVERAGGRARTREAAGRHLDAARTITRDPRLNPVAAAQLRALTDFLADRTR